MTLIFRIVILMVSLAIVITEDSDFDYTSEKAETATDYQSRAEAGAAHLQYDLVNTEYSAVLNRKVEYKHGLQFSAADSILLQTRGRDWTGSSYAKIPISLDKGPVIKVNLKNSNISGSGQDSEVFHISEMRMEVGHNSSVKYLELLVMFSDFKDKHSIQVTIPLFAKAEAPITATTNQVLVVNFPIIKQLYPSNSEGPNANEFVTDIWWMQDVLNSALYRWSKTEDKQSTHAFITKPVLIYREEMENLLNIDIYVKDSVFMTQ